MNGSVTDGTVTDGTVTDRCVIAIAFLLLTGCMSTQSSTAHSAAESHSAMGHAKPAAAPVDSGTRGLAALAAMTFDCPKAALDAAAREAAQVPSQGSYQFAYFRIVSDAHHALYEVHFRSNYTAEPDLRYCVAIYCQQGWDPRTTQPDVRLMKEVGHRSRTRSQDVCTAHGGTKRG